ncbi:MAG: hypothetical protein KatS3mg112_1458 [Thermogutta sp.]|nr:MAG: hypothetical protein KatS3mg112_1458 [Thermogutta sp.]
MSTAGSDGWVLSLLGRQSACSHFPYGESRPNNRGNRPPNASQTTTEEQVTPPEDPAVAAILAANPLTPRERIRAAIVLLKLGRVDLAKQMLQKVVSTPLDPLTLNGLHQEFGSATFFEFASRSDLGSRGPSTGPTRV